MVKKVTAPANKKMFTSINYIKAFACIAVLFVHFRLNLQGMIPSNYFNFKSALFMGIDYQLFIICVPLFFMVTGFLMVNKAFSYSYYIKLGKIILTYVLCSLLTYLILYYFKGQELSWHVIWQQIINYKLINYAWYVKTYLMIYLFFPFLNMFVKLFNAQNKWIFEVLLIIGVTVIGLPTFLMNVGPLPFAFNLDVVYKLYPILYYLIGAYFRKFHREYNLAKLVTLEIFVIISVIGWNMLKRNPYVGGAEGNYPSIILFIQAILLFLILNQVCNKPNKIIDIISKHTLTIYLMSYCVDQIVYAYLLQFVASPKELLPFIIIIVGFNFSVSFGLAWFVDQITNLIWPKLYLILSTPELAIRKIIKINR